MVVVYGTYTSLQSAYQSHWFMNVYDISPINPYWYTWVVVVYGFHCSLLPCQLGPVVPGHPRSPHRHSGLPDLHFFVGGSDQAPHGSGWWFQKGEVFLGCMTHGFWRICLDGGQQNKLRHVGSRMENEAMNVLNMNLPDEQELRE